MTMASFSNFIGEFAGAGASAGVAVVTMWYSIPNAV